MSLSIQERAKLLLNLSVFKDTEQSIRALYHKVAPPAEQYILRMMVKSPWSNGFQIPPELEWLRGTIEQCARVQENEFIDHPFVYVTVRCGEVKSTTDDEWHVDGFSMRVPHLPEQNYIWSNCYPTEALLQRFEFPADFDPLKHNVHQFFQDRANDELIVTLKTNRLYVLDPYLVHRRPVIPCGVLSDFIRANRD